MKAVFLDIETNGLNYELHVPLEVSLIIAPMDSETPTCIYNSLVQCSHEEWGSSQQEALQVNGLSFSDMMGAPSRFEVMNALEDLFKKHGIFKGEAVFICQNPSFDRPFFHKIVPCDHFKNLNFPYHWLDLASMFWAKYYYDRSFVTNVSLSKDAIAQALDIEPESKPHRAFNGAKHLMKCYHGLKKSQLKVKG